MNPIISSMIKSSGRSWWQCRYSDGKVLSEWNTSTLALARIFLPSNKNSSNSNSRWEEVPKKGMVGLRLLCPNGMCGELGAPEGYKFFQLKTGGSRVTMSMSGSMNLDVKSISGHFQDAHIIGVVADADGNCVCRAWETVEEIDEKGNTTKTIPPDARWLIDTAKNWKKNILIGKTIYVRGQLANPSRKIWGCAGSELTIVPVAPPWKTYIPCGADYSIVSVHQRLIDFKDNIYNMKYRNIGRLKIDVQQLRV